MRSHTLSLMLLLASSLSFPSSVLGQLDFEAAPIHYNEPSAHDAIATLQKQLDDGKTQLTFDGERGYLESVLRTLDIPVSSQVLVFSKTSFQRQRISPRRPRAVYFNDDTYIGWVQRGEVVEISTASPDKGAVFYTLRQQRSDHPQFVRDQGQCLACHASSRTSGVPGHLVRSVFASASGQPFFGSGTFTIDHRSPFEQRWGGWYVTGKHGQQRHMGNVIAKTENRPEELDREAGANLTQLDTLVDTTPYLTDHSDIVALMVLEHQVRMHNLITRATFETLSAKRYDEVMNEALGRPADYRSESTTRRIRSAAEKLVDYMLFADEVSLTDPVEGTSGFADAFAARGPFDQHGRSLRQFDLTKRMMRFPCSYLIYSQAFDGLPQETRDVVYRRLHDVLSGQDTSDAYAHLSPADRQAILEILSETKSDLPDYWDVATRS